MVIKYCYMNALFSSEFFMVYIQIVSPFNSWYKYYLYTLEVCVHVGVIFRRVCQIKSRISSVICNIVLYLDKI